MKTQFPYLNMIILSFIRSWLFYLEVFNSQFYHYRLYWDKIDIRQLGIKINLTIKHERWRIGRVSLKCIWCLSCITTKSIEILKSRNLNYIFLITMNILNNLNTIILKFLWGIIPIILLSSCTISQEVSENTKNETELKVSTGNFNKLLTFSPGKCRVELHVDISSKEIEGRGSILDGLLYELGTVEYAKGTVKFSFALMSNDYENGEMVDLANQLTSGNLQTSKAVANTVFVDFIDEETSIYTRWVFSKRESVTLIFIGATDGAFESARQLVNSDLQRMNELAELEDCG